MALHSTECIFYIVFSCIHTCLPVELQCISEITDISVCFVLVLFHRGPAKILVVNTRMRHLKPLQFIGLVSADTAWLSKSSVCAHKHWSFWRHGNAYRADTPHLPRMRGWKDSYLSVSLCFSFSFSLAVYLCLPLPPLNTSCLSEIILFSSSSTAANPIKLGFASKAVIQSLSAVFLQIIYGVKEK